MQAVRAASALGKLRIDCCAGERHHNKIRAASRMVIGSVMLDALGTRPKKETRWYVLSLAGAVLSDSGSDCTLRMSVGTRCSTADCQPRQIYALSWNE